MTVAPDQLGERQRGGQPRRFDAEEVDEARNAVLARALDDEIGGALARPDDLGPDAGIARLQRAVGQGRPIAPDGGVETLAAARVDRVVDVVDPFDIGAEARLAARDRG